MITIPVSVLDAIVQHRPHLATIVANLRANPERAIQYEKALASAYLYGAGGPDISALETLYLAQVAHGGPWGGDWVTTEYASGLTGYSDAHLRRLAGAGSLEAIKRGKVWYVRRDKLPTKSHD